MCCPSKRYVNGQDSVCVCVCMFLAISRLLLIPILCSLKLFALKIENPFDLTCIHIVCFIRSHQIFRLQNCASNIVAFTQIAQVAWNRVIHFAVGVHSKNAAPYAMHATKMHRISDGCRWAPAISALILKWSYQTESQSIK